MAEGEAADSLITEQPDIISPPPKQQTSVSDRSDKSGQQASSISPKQPSSKPINHAEEKLTYAQGAIQERRSLLKTWLATVIGTAIALALGSGIKDLRGLVTTSMTAGSIAFVVGALGNNHGNR